ncbi:lipopolysaccharide biosynthesis protein [Calothrix sp. 336/3]|uniref:lipopolysaccharide biosynthesis protein n=1 Tax=Calothrix sp. 336/3 TaxID=1337936 RepID=UPI0004E363BF|nr:lipopolysaccharide biosynthesis protein [Calothrix sp. 336/3]AKG21026.1 polysaccharide biosynthesis protein [Calothrix sp. 336/3]
MVINKLKHLSSDRFLRNVGWLGVAEIVNRIFRLATTVTLARFLNAYDYGVISIIYTIFDIGNVLTIRAGIGAKIIHAEEKDLKVVCDTSYWLNWILGISLFIFQCLVAYPLAFFYKNNGLILPICAVGLIYLMMPIYTVQSTLIERENSLKITAIANAVQSIVTNLMTVILAWRGFGVWAVVLSMICSYIPWVVIILLNHSWRPPNRFTLDNWQQIASFGSKLLGVDLLSRVRMYLDYMIIGPFLGLEALGMYFFAFNAGLGISQSVINAFTSALFPHLCAARNDKKELQTQFFRSLKTIGLIVVPLVALQITLAPFYVPIVFGQKWVPGIPILILICLSAIPLSLSRATSQLLQAVDKTQVDLYWNLIFTVFFAASLLVAVQGGILWVAIAVLFTQLIAMPIFGIWVIRQVFGKR